MRYRTGDYGRLIQHGAGLAIADLEGREDVIFTAADGLAVPCVDVTQQLQDAGALALASIRRTFGLAAAAAA